MKRKLFAGGIAVIAMLTMGFHAGEYDVVNYKVTLHKGDTVECAAEDFYELSENGESYMSFRARVFDANKQLFADGRVPQSGDVVIVPVMVARK